MEISTKQRLCAITVLHMRGGTSQDEQEEAGARTGNLGLEPLSAEKQAM